MLLEEDGYDKYLNKGRGGDDSLKISESDLPELYAQMRVDIKPREYPGWWWQAPDLRIQGGQILGFFQKHYPRVDQD